MYSLIGKQVRVYLYAHGGEMMGPISGRVADVAADVEVRPGMKKDLAFVIDIEVPEGEVPYRHVYEKRNEGWFAIQDMEIIEDEEVVPGWFNN